MDSNPKLNFGIWCCLDADEELLLAVSMTSTMGPSTVYSSEELRLLNKIEM
jgi:hypothetical protein